MKSRVQTGTRWDRKSERTCRDFADRSLPEKFRGFFFLFLLWNWSTNCLARRQYFPLNRIDYATLLALYNVILMPILNIFSTFNSTSDTRIYNLFIWISMANILNNYKKVVQFSFILQKKRSEIYYYWHKSWKSIPENETNVKTLF